MSSAPSQTLRCHSGAILPAGEAGTLGRTEPDLAGGCQSSLGLSGWSAGPPDGSQPVSASRGDTGLGGHSATVLRGCLCLDGTGTQPVTSCVQAPPWAGVHPCGCGVFLLIRPWVGGVGWCLQGPCPTGRWPERGEDLHVGSGVRRQVGKQVEGQGALRHRGWEKIQQRASFRVGGGGVGFFTA